MGDAGIRILHFSDVHVQRRVFSAPKRELMGKRLLAGLNLWLSRGRLFAEAPQKLAELAKFAVQERVSLALCTGDYTAIGTRAEHADARAHVEALRRDAPLGLVTVPGNHDLYLPDTLRDRRFDQHFSDVLGSDMPAYAVDGAYPFVRLFGEHLAVVGVNSARPNRNPFASSGRVPEAQLEALGRILVDARLSGRWIIVMTHYGILRPGGEPDSKSHGLDNADALARICARPGLLLVHGHIHHRYCHPPSAAHPWLFCAGSATHRGREGFWLYDVEAEQIRAIPGGFQAGHYVLREAEALTIRRPTVALDPR